MAAKHAFLSAFALAILCTSFAREMLHENQENQPSRLVVKGRVFCDTCVLHQFSNTSHFISGALVAVDCKMNRKTPTVSVRGKTDENGEFKVELNSISHFQRACRARLLSSPEESCDVPLKAKTSHITFTSNLNGLLTCESPPLTYRPRNVPTSLCLYTDKDKQERSSKQTILPPLLPENLLPNVPPLSSLVPPVSHSFIPPLSSFVPPVSHSLVPPLSSLVPPLSHSLIPPLSNLVPPLSSLVPPVSHSLVPPLSSLVPPVSHSLVPPVSPISLFPPLSSLVPPLSSLVPTLPCVPKSIPHLHFPRLHAPPLPISIPFLTFPTPPKH